MWNYSIFSLIVSFAYVGHEQGSVLSWGGSIRGYNFMQYISIFLIIGHLKLWNQPIGN